MTMFNLKIHGVKTCVNCSAICPPNPCLGKHISVDLSWCLDPVGKFNSWADALPKTRVGCSWVLAHQLLANAISWRKTFNCSNIDFYRFHSHCHDSRFITFRRKLACGRSCGARGASQTTQMGVFRGTTFSHSVHKPICMKEEARLVFRCKTWRHKLILERKV